ncbi:hypothetical protein CRM22_003429 [Opisthorchis felineus]|uniref:Uncharacterized protein n=1 Tax=Opisthorchis felineus TaxID=147828 RepID=A0A4S2M661_OPIFE|nr:hypothetical protein CRM22_003429 [Opisthorchis felineus]
MLFTSAIFLFTFLVSEHVVETVEPGSIDCYTCTNCQLPIDDSTPIIKNCHQCEVGEKIT